MKLPALIAVLAFTIAAAPAALAAAEQPAPAKKHRVLRAPQQQIACTVLGCAPIPLGCYPTAGYTIGGIPSGYDVIVCPPGRR